MAKTLSRAADLPERTRGFMKKSPQGLTKREETMATSAAARGKGGAEVGEGSTIANISGCAVLNFIAVFLARANKRADGANDKATRSFAQRPSSPFRGLATCNGKFERLPVGISTAAPYPRDSSSVTEGQTRGQSSPNTHSKTLSLEKILSRSTMATVLSSVVFILLIIERVTVGKWWHWLLAERSG